MTRVGVFLAVFCKTYDTKYNERPKLLSLLLKFMLCTYAQNLTFAFEYLSLGYVYNKHFEVHPYTVFFIQNVHVIGFMFLDVLVGGLGQ